MTKYPQHAVARFDLVYEAAQLFHVALPSVLIQFALYWPFPVAAASVGTELGSVELAGFSLGCLVGNLTCLSIMEGSLTAADTLMPRAFGAKQYKEVARLSVRAFCMGCFLLAIPIVPLCFFSSWILKSLGQNSRASDLAQDWIRVYFWGALPNLAFRVLMRFLLAQQKPWPLVFAAGLPALVIHPFLIRTLVPTWDLMGSAWSIVFVQWIAFFLLAAYLWIHPVYHPETWPDLSSPVLVAKALQWEPTWQFLRLAIGGVLSMNEWWFFEIMCFIAGSMGVVSLDAHTVAYNLVPLLFMLALGVSIGLSVRMGHVIANEPRRAKLMAAYCMGFMVMLGAAVGFALHFFRYEVILLFTKDKEVVDMALQIWSPLCFYIFLIYVMGTSIAILRALGMQWRAAGIICVTLYGFTLPIVVYFTLWRGGGLVAQWHVLPICYIFMQIALICGYTCMDWGQHAAKIRMTLAKTAEDPPHHEFLSEETPLVV